MLVLSCLAVELFWDRFDGHVTGGVAADAAFAAWRNGGSRVWVSLFTTVGCFCGCVGGFDLLLFLGPESDVDCIVSCPLCLVCWEFTFFFFSPLPPPPSFVCVCVRSCQSSECSCLFDLQIWGVFENVIYHFRLFQISPFCFPFFSSFFLRSAWFLISKLIHVPNIFVMGWSGVVEGQDTGSRVSQKARPQQAYGKQVLLYSSRQFSAHPESSLARIDKRAV